MNNPDSRILIYCDESCHLRYDKSNVMVLGGITCPESEKTKVFNELREIKIAHGLSSWAEIKWTKVTASKIELYQSIIDYFFANESLCFRAVIACKEGLDIDKYHEGDYDTWYYKMYFQLLREMIDLRNEYRIFIDIKDTRGGPRTKKLKEVLCNNKWDFAQERLKDISQIPSHDSEIMQICDLLIGALSYYHRGLYRLGDSNKGKNTILDQLSTYGISMDTSTPKYEPKFNVFIWKPRGTY